MFLCIISENFSGPVCEIDKNDCADVNCLNNGTCIDKQQNFLCACASHSGYFGDR